MITCPLCGTPYSGDGQFQACECEVPAEWWTQVQARECAMCLKTRPCTLVAGIQPGFPEGEWMCKECL